MMDLLLRILGYVIAVVGIGLLFASFGFRWSVIRRRMAMTQKKKEELYDTTLRNHVLFSWYDRLLQAAIHEYRPYMFVRLMNYQTVAFLGITVILLFLTKSIFYAVFMAIVFSYIVPAGYLYIKLAKIKANTQQDLSKTVIKLLQYYMKNSHNMLYALKDLSKDLKGDSQQVFGMLFVRLESGQQPPKEAADIFSMQVGTWGRNLAITILRAVEEGTNVEGILQDYSRDLTEFSKRLGQAETNGREVAQLGKLPIILIPILIIVNAQFAMQKNAYAYLLTPIGTKVFVLSIILALIGLALAKMLERPKPMK